jgi:hypothetical protein
MHTKFWLGNLKGRDHVEGLDVDEVCLFVCLFVNHAVSLVS